MPRHDDASLIYAVGRVNQGIRRAMRARLAEWELSVAEYTTLAVLAARPELSNAQLARRALVAPQSMLEILARLEERGLVERRIDPAHGRILRARLTPEGLELLSLADARVQALQDEIFAGVPVAGQRATLAAMRTAMANLSGQPQPEHQDT